MYRYAIDLQYLMSDKRMEDLRKQYSIPSEKKDKAAALMLKREKESYEREMVKIHKRRDARFEYKGSAYMPWRKLIARNETYNLRHEQRRHDEAYSKLRYYELNEKLKNGLKLLRLETYENKVAETNKMMEITGFTRSLVQKFFKLLETNRNKTDANNSIDDDSTDKKLRNSDKIRIQEIADEAELSSVDLLEKAKELGFNVKGAHSTIIQEDAGILLDYVISGTLPKNFKKESEQEQYT